MNIMQCMQPNFLLAGEVYPMLMSSVPREWGTLDRKSTLFKSIVKFFLKGVIFMFWHDIVYTELLYCVTNFELVWTWNKVAVVENAKECRLYPTFPYIQTCACQQKSANAIKKHVSILIYPPPNPMWYFQCLITFSVDAILRFSTCFAFSVCPDC